MGHCDTLVGAQASLGNCDTLIGAGNIKDSDVMYQPALENPPQVTIAEVPIKESGIIMAKA